MTASHSALNIPDVIEADGETFTVLAVLGRGGMGVVYKARSQQFDRIVALKMLHENLYADALASQRLKREASAAATFSHPHIVNVYRFATHAQTPFIVMEYVNGKTLSDIIDTDGTVPWQQVVAWFSQALDALAAIHDKGFAHRDIKPSNIIVTTDGGIKISDFGIAKPYMDGEAQRMTQTGMMVGSPAYMSPEQCAGAKVDPRSDLYSLACSMYHALSGNQPFDADSPLELMFKHINDQATTLQNIGNPAIANVVAKAMEKKLEDRYQTAAEFISALLDAGNHSPGSDAVISRKPRRKKQRFALPPYAVPLALALACAVAGILCISLQNREQVAPASQAADHSRDIFVGGYRVAHQIELQQLPMAQRADRDREFQALLEKEIKAAQEAKRVDLAAELMRDRALTLSNYDAKLAAQAYQETVRYIDAECAQRPEDIQLWDRQIDVHTRQLEFEQSDHAKFEILAKRMEPVIARGKLNFPNLYHKYNSDLYRRRANKAHSQALLPQAEQLARQALVEENLGGRTTRPDYFSAVIILCAILRAEGKYNEVNEIVKREMPRCETAALSDPDSYIWVTHAGLAMNGANNAATLNDRKSCDRYFDIAVRSARKGCEDDFNLSDRYVMQATNYSTLNDTEAVFAMASKAKELCDGDLYHRGLSIEGRLVLASAAMNTGRPKIAYEEARRFLPLLPKEVPSTQFSGYLAYAQACVDTKRLDEARTYLTKASELRAAVEQLPEWLVNLQTTETRLALATGDVEGARKQLHVGLPYLEAASKRNPGMAAVFRQEYDNFKKAHGS